MSVIRGDDPFADRPEDRDPGRRLRGRLAAPVTVWTAQADTTGPTAITVASIMVADGDPATVLGLVDPLSELADAVAASSRFVVHVVAQSQYRLADQLAGRSPTALDRFDDVEVTASAWGPVVDALVTRAYCSSIEAIPVGGSLLLRGTVDRFELPDPSPAPLVYLRGLYRATTPLPDRPPDFR